MQTIFIMDYSADTALVLCKWLEQHGYTTKSFSTPGQMIAQFKYTMPDCIILDSLSGGVFASADLCHLIRSVFNYEGKIVISTTGRVPPADWEAYDAVEFIAKPFNLHTALQVVNKVLEDAVAENN